MRCDRTPRRGLTLIELMIVLAVGAILVAVAYPSYTAQLAKGRRADAKQGLVELAQVLERWYSERGTYAGATLGSGGIYPSSSRGGYYTLRIVSATADAYAITAAPTGVQASDGCGTFGYNQVGTASVSGTTPLAQCW